MHDKLFNLASQAASVSQQTQSRASDSPTLPSPEALARATSSLPQLSHSSFLHSHGQSETLRHITKDIVPALNGQASSARYYGFVTGGTLPVAEWADNVVSRVDQNVQVHLPSQTVATAVDSKASEMVASLLGLDPASTWKGRTFTTGATASNILGLACGRDMVLHRRGASVGELGLFGAAVAAGVKGIQVLTSGGHSSLSKAASVVGLGRASVKELRRSEKDEPWRLDLDAVERELAREGMVSIVAVSAGEVNTGGFAVCGRDEWARLRRLADTYGAWIHVDGAFGIYVRALEKTSAFARLHAHLEGIELADSIAIDGHKLLNVPYDCGLFLTRSISTLQMVFTNPNAPYLSATSADGIPSPLNLGIENSRRWRALPAYAVLHSEGRQGMAAILGNMVELARKIAVFLRASSHYEILANGAVDTDNVSFVLLFRAKDRALNEVLVDKINETRQMYVSGTQWAGEKAARMAISTWKVDVERDARVVTEILQAVSEGRWFDMNQSP